MTLLILLVLQGAAGLPAVEGLLAESRFDEAIVAGNAFVQGGGKRRDELGRGYLLLGRAYASAGQADQAVTAFVRSLTLVPGIGLPPDAPPKVVDPFMTARRLAGSGAGLRLEATTLRAAPGALPVLAVRVEGDPLGLVTRLKLHARGGASPWTQHTLAVGGAAAEIPLGSVAGPRPGALHYFLEAFDSFGNVIAGVASQDRPLVALPAPLPAAPSRDAPADEPVYRRAWFWPVLAGGAAALAFGVAAPFVFGGADRARVPFGGSLEVQ